MTTYRNYNNQFGWLWWQSSPGTLVPNPPSTTGQWYFWYGCSLYVYCWDCHQRPGAPPKYHDTPCFVLIVWTLTGFHCWILANTDGFELFNTCTENYSISVCLYETHAICVIDVVYKINDDQSVLLGRVILYKASIHRPVCTSESNNT